MDRSMIDLYILFQSSDDGIRIQIPKIEMLTPTYKETFWINSPNPTNGEKKTNTHILAGA